jgi:hypothetical protein
MKNHLSLMSLMPLLSLKSFFIKALRMIGINGTNNQYFWANGIFRDSLMNLFTMNESFSGFRKEIDNETKNYF